LGSKKILWFVELVGNVNNQKAFAGRRVMAIPRGERRGGGEGSRLRERFKIEKGVERKRGFQRVRWRRNRLPLLSPP